MLRKFLNVLFVAAMLIIFSSPAFSEIIVENANDTWDQSLSSTSAPEVLPRIIVEYSTSLTEKDLIIPTDLLLSSSSVGTRILVEYATTIARLDLATPPCKGDFDKDGDVDGLDLNDYRGNADRLPMVIFGLSYGRNNCLDP